MERVSCKKCGAKALLSTVEKTNGYCMPCFKGPNKKSFWQRSQDIAVRMGIIKESDRVEDTALPEQYAVDSGDFYEEQDYGKSITEILSQAGDVEDAILVSHIGKLLTEKESKSGIDSFSDSEKVFYIVGDMIRQLDSGGFGSYFYNTGHLAHFLVSSLDQIASVECKNIAENAISKLGGVPSSDYDEMLDELAKRTNNFEDNLWDEEDDAFFDLEENLDEMLMNYVKAKSDQFQL